MRAIISDVSDVRNKVTAEEWAVRVDLAACYRLVAHFGWDDLVFTHISARVPGTHDFLINPYGLMFDEVTASNLVRVDLAGNKTLESPYEINPAGYTIHSAIHEVRADANCVLHLHTMAGIAVSVRRPGCCRCRNRPASSRCRSRITTTKASHSIRKRRDGSRRTWGRRAT